MARSINDRRAKNQFLAVAFGIAFGICVGVVFGLPAAQAVVGSTPAKISSGPELQTIEFFLKGFDIKKKYASMNGPQRRMTITSKIPDSGSTLWIKSMTVETQDENHDAISSEFLCHAWLTFKSAETKDHGMLSVSQGTETVTFPDGYAFPVPVTDDYKVVLTGMAENSNYPTIDQKMVLKYSISYYTDEEASKYKIKTLETFNLVARPEADAAHPRKHEVKPGLKSHHWLVPPGRHTYKAPAFRALFETANNPLGIGENARMHFIRIHLHGYGESVGLFDKTTGEEVWKGYAKNHKTLRHLLDVDSYSDSEGIALYPDHEYELEVVYDNPTGEPVDAMGALRVFIAEK